MLMRVAFPRRGLFPKMFCVPSARAFPTRVMLSRERSNLAQGIIPTNTAVECSWRSFRWERYLPLKSDHSHRGAAFPQRGLFPQGSGVPSAQAFPKGVLRSLSAGFSHRCASPPPKKKCGSFSIGGLVPGKLEFAAIGEFQYFKSNL